MDEGEWVPADHESVKSRMFITAEGDITYDNKVTSYKEPEVSTQSPVKSADIYIDDGNIVTGEDAAIVRALHEYEQVRSRCNKSFKITLRQPQTAEHSDSLHQDHEEKVISKDSNDASTSEGECRSSSIHDQNSENDQQVKAIDLQPSNSEHHIAEADVSQQQIHSELDADTRVDGMRLEDTLIEVDSEDSETTSLNIETVQTESESDEDYDEDNSDSHNVLVQNLADSVTACSDQYSEDKDECNDSQDCHGEGQSHNVDNQNDHQLEHQNDDLGGDYEFVTSHSDSDFSDEEFDIDNNMGPISSSNHDSDSDTDEELCDSHRSHLQLERAKRVKVNEHKASKVSSTKNVRDRKLTKAPSEVTALSTDTQVISEKVQCLNSDTTIKGFDVQTATVDTKVIETKLQAGTVVNNVEGVEVKTAAADFKGVSAKAGASLNTTAKASTITTGSLEATGAKVEIQSTADPTAQGVSCKTGTLSMVGTEIKASTSAKATISSAKVQTGVASFTGVKTGATAEAKAELTGLDTKIGTVEFDGIDVSATATASAKAGHEVNVGRAKITPFDGVGASASVSAKSGAQMFCADVGVSGHIGVNFSTIPQIGCFTFKPGLPKLNIGAASFFSFGIGGGVDGPSRQHVGVVTAGESRGTDSHGGASTQGQGGHGNTTGDDINGNTTGDDINGNTTGNDINGHTQGTASSLAHGSIVGHGHVTLHGNVHTSRIHVNNGLSVGGSVSVGGVETNTHKRSHAQVHLKGDAITEENSRAGLKHNESPIHIKAFNKLVKQHKQDKHDEQDHTRSPSGIGAGPLVSRQVGEQLQGSGAKFQAILNEEYPLLPGERVSGSSNRNPSDIESIKKAAIKRLKKGDEAGGTGSNMTGSSHPSKAASAKCVPKKAKRSGPRNNIVTLDSLKETDESSKEITRINNDSSRSFIAGFKDLD